MYKFYVAWVNTRGPIPHFHWTYLRATSDHIDQQGVEYFYKQLRNLSNTRFVILTWHYIGIWEEEDGQELNRALEEARSESIPGRMPDMREVQGSSPVRKNEGR